MFGSGGSKAGSSVTLDHGAIRNSPTVRDLCAAQYRLGNVGQWEGRSLVWRAQEELGTVQLSEKAAFNMVFERRRAAPCPLGVHGQWATALLVCLVWQGMIHQEVLNERNHFQVPTPSVQRMLNFLCSTWHPAVQKKDANAMGFANDEMLGVSAKHVSRTSGQHSFPMDFPEIVEPRLSVKSVPPNAIGFTLAPVDAFYLGQNRLRPGQSKKSAFTQTRLMSAF